MPRHGSCAVRLRNRPRRKAPTSSDERTVADTGTTDVPAQSQRAESLALLPSVVRDVVPVGGDNVIAPQPSRIAYYENAEGTTAVDVSVDERGTAGQMHGRPNRPDISCWTNRSAPPRCACVTFRAPSTDVRFRASTTTRLRSSAGEDSQTPALTHLRRNRAKPNRTALR